MEFACGGRKRETKFFKMELDNRIGPNAPFFVKRNLNAEV